MRLCESRRTEETILWLVTAGLARFLPNWENLWIRGEDCAVKAIGDIKTIDLAKFPQGSSEWQREILDILADYIPVEAKQAAVYFAFLGTLHGDGEGKGDWKSLMTKIRAAYAQGSVSGSFVNFLQDKIKSNPSLQMENPESMRGILDEGFTTFFGVTAYEARDHTGQAVDFRDFVYSLYFEILDEKAILDLVQRLEVAKDDIGLRILLDIAVAKHQEQSKVILAIYAALAKAWWLDLDASTLGDNFKRTIDKHKGSHTPKMIEELTEDAANGWGTTMFARLDPFTDRLTEIISKHPPSDDHWKETVKMYQTPAPEFARNLATAFAKIAETGSTSTGSVTGTSDTTSNTATTEYSR